MEASAAGAPAAAQDATQNGQQGTEAAAGPDFAALQEKFDAMEGTQKEMFQWMQSQAAASDEGDDSPEAALAAADLSFLDDSDPSYDPEQAAANLAALIERAADEKTQAAIAPIAQRQAAMETRQAIDDLTAKYPEIGTPEVASEVIRISKEKAEIMGRPDLAGSPDFWELIYLSGRAADRANKEGEEPGVAHLEGASGAGPGGGGQVDLGDAIVNAGGRGSSVLPFG